MTTTTNNKCQQLYANYQDSIGRLMDVLQQELDLHAANALSEGANRWGSVGDLAEVQSRMVDMIGFVSGKSREQIEDFLSDK